MKYETQNTGIENMRYDFMPVGSIVPFASDIIPLGWLLCDGAPIERNRYPELYDLIGDKLPDHRGMFLRGNDNGRGIDAGRILGSEQGDAIRNITGDLSVRIGNVLNHDILMPDEMAFYTKKKGSFGGSASRVVSLPESPLSELSILTMDVSRVVPTAEENRPKNNSVNYIIKALHIANPSMEYQVADGLNHKIETNRNTIDFNLLATLGISYGGILNNTSPKLAGVAYYDEIARKLFKCIEDTSINYADATYFVAISNNDLSTTVEKSGDWYIIRHGNKFKEFLISVVPQPIKDGVKIAFPENFTDINSINIQLTECTSTTASYRYVGIVGFSEVTLSGFMFRLYRPNELNEEAELFSIRVFGM